MTETYYDNKDRISFLVYIGIIIFILPVVLTILKLKLPSIVSKFGLLLLVIGIMHTFWLRRK